MSHLQNIHTHTTYCDGSLSAEEMIKAALAMGNTAIGFSEHSHVYYDPVYSMTPEATLKYAAEISALKEKYRGRIEVFLGLEQDYFTDIDLGLKLDYVIGAVHNITPEICIDNGAKNQRMMADRHYGGDYYSLIEAYFAIVADIAVKTNADVIGHFDLITKYNVNGSLFDESHPRFLAAACAAMEQILKTCNLFEVNTGAMYRVNKLEPYPSARLLKELNKRGGEVLISSDSHDAGSICWKFDEMRELLKACGFEYIKVLTNDGFINEKLS